MDIPSPVFLSFMQRSHTGNEIVGDKFGSSIRVDRTADCGYSNTDVIV